MDLPPLPPLPALRTLPELHALLPLLLLFIGLFVVNHALQHTGLAADAVADLTAQGVHLNDPGPLLVLASTFAGNLLLVGSIANLIVVDLAEKAGIRIDWRRHARTGTPVTLGSLAVLWLTFVAWA